MQRLPKRSNVSIVENRGARALRFVERDNDLVRARSLDHRHEPAPAMIERTGPDEIVVTFDEPQRAITPGQAAVFTMETSWLAVVGSLRKPLHIPTANSSQQEASVRSFFVFLLFAPPFLFAQSRFDGTWQMKMDTLLILRNIGGNTCWRKACITA